jgi:hypothetical protein
VFFYFINFLEMKKVEISNLDLIVGGLDKASARGYGCTVGLLSAAALLTATGAFAFIGVGLFTYGAVVCATGVTGD